MFLKIHGSGYCMANLDRRLTLLFPPRIDVFLVISWKVCVSGRSRYMISKCKRRVSFSSLSSIFSFITSQVVANYKLSVIYEVHVTSDT